MAWGRGELTDAEADEHARLVAATGEIESMSVAISRELAPLAEALRESGITPSEETKVLLTRLFEMIREASQSALSALVDRDERAAQSVVARRDAVWKLTAQRIYCLWDSFYARKSLIFARSIGYLFSRISGCKCADRISSAYAVLRCTPTDTVRCKFPDIKAPTMRSVPSAPL